MTNNSKNGEQEDAKSLMTLLLDYIKYNAEHSRWSTSITFFMSVTVASIIALLGFYIESKEGLIYQKTPNYSFISIPIDSLRCIFSDSPDKLLSDKDKHSLKLYCPEDSDSLKLVPVKLATTQTNCETKQNSSNKYFQQIAQVEAKFSIENNSSRSTVLEISFFCASILGLMFTSYFYFLRRKTEEKIRNIEEDIKSIEQTNKNNCPFVKCENIQTDGNNSK
ncbi:MAG: hypothetical protein FWD60_00135 [Candidatus Azobacteroides sp.]|nr:hypothetical protein [Candidatus Azobacteroides sp.]